MYLSKSIIFVFKIKRYYDSLYFQVAQTKPSDWSFSGSYFDKKWLLIKNNKRCWKFEIGLQRLSPENEGFTSSTHYKNNSKIK